MVQNGDSRANKFLKMPRFYLVWCGFFVFQLLITLTNPLGYFYVYSNNPYPKGIHNLTILLYSIIMIYYYDLMHEYHFIIRVLLVGLLSYSGYQIYDYWWRCFFLAQTGAFTGATWDIILISGLGAFLTRALWVLALFWVINHFSGKKVRIQWRFLGLTILICMLSNYTLFRSNWFTHWHYHTLGLRSDPHNWLWFGGKLISTLSSLLICSKTS